MRSILVLSCSRDGNIRNVVPLPCQEQFRPLKNHFLCPLQVLGVLVLDLGELLFPCKGELAPEFSKTEAFILFSVSG